MCMYINKNAKAKKPNTDGFCMAWKVLNNNNEAPLQNFQYDVGENFSSRVCPSFPVDKMHTPENDDEVYEGFHLFLSRRNARKWRSYGKEKVIKVYYKPEHVVAYGTLGSSTIQTVAVSRLTIKSLKGE